MKSERLALAILILILLGLPAAVFGYQRIRTATAGVRVIDLDAQLPEVGGWAPEVLRITAGEQIRLRLHSPDVLHSFAIGRTEVGPIDIVPGKVTEIEFSINEPGTYTFYCTRWCSTNHWRMRGTLEVTAADGTIPLSAQEPAPYIALGIDLDRGHGHLDSGPEPVATPPTPPSAAAGAELGVPPPLITLADTPAGIYQVLRASYSELTDADLWNLIAHAWAQESTADQVTLGETLYQRDCAACHGLEGQGDGIMARELPEEPYDWRDPAYLMSASDALLHGKIVRGGMGTGMPGWGNLYTDEEAWAVVAYLRTLSLPRQ
jgi:mono/diheme cytochrome c family protein